MAHEGRLILGDLIQKAPHAHLRVDRLHLPLQHPQLLVVDLRLRLVDAEETLTLAAARVAVDRGEFLELEAWTWQLEGISRLGKPENS